MKLAIRMKQQPDGAYRACCPSLPGCSVYGLTKEDANSKIGSAVHGYLARLDVCLPRELSRAMAIEMAYEHLAQFRPLRNKEHDSRIPRFETRGAPTIE
jgi:predicted RNase H-like HicB family nuclease